MVHVPLMFLSEWREFPQATCVAGKKNLMTARVSMLLKSRPSPDMFPFSLCNKKRLAIRRMNRPLFPTTLSTPSSDIGKQVGLRSYQHPLIHRRILIQKTHSTKVIFIKTVHTLSNSSPQTTNKGPKVALTSTIKTPQPINTQEVS